MSAVARLRLNTALIALAPVAYAASMFLPADESGEAGYTLAYLSMIGTIDRIPVCMLGLLANLTFVAGWIVVLVRRCAWPRHRGGLGGAIVGTIAAVAMVMAWAGLWHFYDGGMSPAGINFGRLAESFTPGAVAWMLSGGLLCAAGWLGQVGRRTGRPARGFEIVAEGTSLKR